MDGDIYQLMQLKKQQKELTVLVSCNSKTGQFGLSLTEEEATQLMVSRNDSLKRYKRVEFGGGILDKLIFTFCDSRYINQDNYLETMERLQDVFYEFKNESADKLTDDELMTFMREQFEEICFGDIDYLESTCLVRFAEAVRAGYTDYQKTGGSNEYGNFSEEQRWDKDVYLEVVSELFW
jgi:hypothetical protein